MKPVSVKCSCLDAIANCGRPSHKFLEQGTVLVLNDLLSSSTLGLPLRRGKWRCRSSREYDEGEDGLGEPCQSLQIRACDFLVLILRKLGEDCFYGQKHNFSMFGYEAGFLQSVQAVLSHIGHKHADTNSLVI